MSSSPRSRAVAVFCAALLLPWLSSCGGSSNSAGSAADLRVVDAVHPASTSFDVLPDGTSIASNLAYGQATALQALTTGTRQLQFEPAQTSTVILRDSFTADRGYDYSVLARAGLPARPT